ncbi:hypothetical protein HDU96_003784, partial [Phlyctochytrium bullatum]
NSDLRTMSSSLEGRNETVREASTHEHAKEAENEAPLDMSMKQAITPIEIAPIPNDITPGSPVPPSGGTILVDESCVSDYFPPLPNLRIHPGLQFGGGISAWQHDIDEEEGEDIDEEDEYEDHLSRAIVRAAELPSFNRDMLDVEFEEEDVEVGEILDDYDENEEPLFYDVWRSMGTAPRTMRYITSDPIRIPSPPPEDEEDPEVDFEEVDLRYRAGAPPPPIRTLRLTPDELPPNLMCPSWGSNLSPNSFINVMSPSPALAATFRRCFEARLRNLRNEALDANGNIDETGRHTISSLLGRAPPSPEEDANCANTDPSDPDGLDDEDDVWVFKRSARQMELLRTEMEAVEEIISRLETITPIGR